MRSRDFRSPSALLEWLGTLSIAVSGVAGAACTWVPGSDTAIVRRPAQEPAHHNVICRTPTSCVERASADGVDETAATLGADECKRLCSSDPFAPPPKRCQLVRLALEPARTNELAVLCEYHYSGRFETFTPFGRRSSRRAALPEPRTAAEHYERAAYAETAAILAFQQLAFDLEALGADRALFRACRRAAQDEARHARVSLSLCRHFGGAARRPWPALPRPARRVPTPFAVALENASGGCASEVFGTWLQLYQAKHAPSPNLAAVAMRIAEDEARHAALAFELFDFFERKLDLVQRAEIRSAMRREVSKLGGSPGPSPLLACELGLPNQSEMRCAALAIERALPETASSGLRS